MVFLTRYENRADAVKASGADFGIAWDADFDRCFLFDADGDFIEGYYIAGLLAEVFIEKNTNSKLKDADGALERVTNKYKPLASVVDTTDGLGLEFHACCFNLRKSNTEPVIRLNVKSKAISRYWKKKPKKCSRLFVQSNCIPDIST